jgi:hypothetical protein
MKVETYPQFLVELSNIKSHQFNIIHTLVLVPTDGETEGPILIGAPRCMEGARN